MPHTFLGALHLGAAVFAMAVGATVLLMKGKGNRRHRQLGIAYAIGMLVTNATALMIYRLFGGFGPFHVFALVSLVGIVMGWRAIYQARAARTAGQMLKRAHHIEVHYYWITWSYAGLMAAAASEAITRLPAFSFVRDSGRSFGIGVAIATAAVIAGAAVLINGPGRRALAPFKRETGTPSVHP